MGSEEISRAHLLAHEVAAAIPGAVVEHSDGSGPDAEADPRLGEQLAIIAGRRLSQFGMAVNGLRLMFWGEHLRSVSREILIEHPTVEIADLGREAVTCDSVSETVAVALLPALGQQVRDVTITAGRLTVVFGTGVTLTVEPGERYESWQISSDDGLLVVCNPGGDLTVWYPPARA